MEANQQSATSHPHAPANQTREGHSSANRADELAAGRGGATLAPPTGNLPAPMTAAVPRSILVRNIRMDDQFHCVGCGSEATHAMVPPRAVPPATEPSILPICRDCGLNTLMEIGAALGFAHIEIERRKSSRAGGETIVLAAAAERFPVQSTEERND